LIRIRITGAVCDDRDFAPAGTRQVLIQKPFDAGALVEAVTRLGRPAGEAPGEGEPAARGGRIRTGCRRGTAGERRDRCRRNVLNAGELVGRWCGTPPCVKVRTAGDDAKVLADGLAEAAVAENAARSLWVGAPSHDARRTWVVGATMA
jgi:hypothetical protein